MRRKPPADLEIRNFNMNKLGVVIGVVLGILSIGNTYGILAVLPYRLAEQEKKSAITQAQVESQRTDYQNQRELLVRIDERLKQLQSTVDKGVSK